MRDTHSEILSFLFWVRFGSGCYLLKCYQHTTKKYFNCLCTSVSAFSRECLLSLLLLPHLWVCFLGFLFVFLLILYMCASAYVFFFGLGKPANQCRQQINDNNNENVEGHIGRATNGV